MVSAPVNPATPNLIPVPPDWLRRKEEQQPVNANRNINDIYWRKPDGWIVVGPSAELGANGRPLTAQAEGLIRRGWTPLLEYSYTNRVGRSGHRETIEVTEDKLGTPDRYYWLFANGGAHLFTIEQIVEHHWHITPPHGLPKSVFPQLQEWDVPDPYFCPACPGTRPPKNSVEQVSTHLMVEHRMTLVQARELQQQTNDFRDMPRGASGLAIRRKAQAIESSATGEAFPPSPEMAPRLILCNQCGEKFTNYPARARHMKADHASPIEGREDTYDA